MKNKTGTPQRLERYPYANKFGLTAVTGNYQLNSLFGKLVL
jgi:hypothetical protein